MSALAQALLDRPEVLDVDLDDERVKAIFDLTRATLAAAMSGRPVLLSFGEVRP